MNKTKIPWCDYTWNPITGCSPISEGCEKCYAHALAKRFNGGDFKPMFHGERLMQPTKVLKPSKIFVCSTGDIFHDDVETIWIDQVLDVVVGCPQHTFMMLTKRAHNIEKKLYEVTVENPCRYLGGGDWYPNMWMGITGENQKRLDERWHYLKRLYVANTLFFSLEPLLEPIILTGGQLANCEWCIVGAETGPGARPMGLSWARDLRDQCAAAGVPFFFKSAGPGIETPEDLKIRQFPEVS